LNRLIKLFRKYTDIVQLSLLGLGKKRSINGMLRLIANEQLELQAAVEILESEEIFHQLTLETLSTDPVRRSLGSKNEMFFQKEVKNFFRRSSYYINIFEGKKVNTENIFQIYLAAFQRQEIQVNYLAPMELVEFAEEIMDFNTFQIRRFSATDLDEILGNRINKIFYPWATIDLEKLKGYWFICLKEIIPGHRLSHPILNLNDLNIVDNKHTNFPKPLEVVLQQLTLYDWQPDFWRDSSERERQLSIDLDKGWFGFIIPFVLISHDDLLSSPRPTPNISELEKQPVINSNTGEEIGESPTIYINLDKSETEQFKTFIQRIREPLIRLKDKKNDWLFFDVALENFIKAFSSEGLEQLLWHITTLEALLGENKSGITDLLARRVASILGRSEKERKNIRGNFKELYIFRSNLVHGKSHKPKTYQGHLRYARDLSRKVLLWFLSYLNEVQAELPPDHEIKREDLLILIDLDRSSRINLNKLLNIFPAEFPHISKWIEK
jgi:hypothetical protein